MFIVMFVLAMLMSPPMNQGAHAASQQQQQSVYPTPHSGKPIIRNSPPPG